MQASWPSSVVFAVFSSAAFRLRQTCETTQHEGGSCPRDVAEAKPFCADFACSPHVCSPGTPASSHSQTTWGLG